jgi:nitroreductase
VASRGQRASAAARFDRLGAAALQRCSVSRGRSLKRLEAILDLARWAPSGDNSQPWRFEIRSPRHVVVHAVAPKLGVYDLLGHASLVSVGALLETLRIAASADGFVCRSSVQADGGSDLARIDVWLEPTPGLAPDPLHAFILRRTVQRRPLETRALDESMRLALEAAVGSSFRVVWFARPRDRLRFAWLAVRSAKIRLTIPEAYEVHRQVIEWDASTSEDRIPDRALGADALSVRSMRWVLQSWPRVQRMNRWFGGTILPRVQLELIPGLRCAAHFALVADRPPSSVADHLAAGAAVQRFWLTATGLGLQMQPQYTPLAFAGYVRRGTRFTEVAAATARAVAVAAMLDRLLHTDADRAVFLGRLGHGAAATARSVRLPLERLAWPDPGQRPDPPLV